MIPMVVTHGRLSALIRAGAALRGAAEGDYRIDTPTGAHTCALGAAYEAATGELPPVRGLGSHIPTQRADELVGAVLEEATGFNMQQRVKLPGTWAGQEVTLLPTVMAWNDDLHWSRERIADELEQIGF